MTDFKARFTKLADITHLVWGGEKERRTYLLDDSEDTMTMTLGGYMVGDPETGQPSGYIRMMDVLEVHSIEPADVEYVLSEDDDEDF